MPVKKIEVDDDNSGRRLDNFLLSVYKNVPKSKIYNIIRKGEVRINSGRVNIGSYEPQASSKLINE